MRKTDKIEISEKKADRLIKFIVELWDGQQRKNKAKPSLHRKCNGALKMLGA